MWKNLRRQVSVSDSFLSISFEEKLLLFLKSAGITCLLNFCFYRHMLAFLPLSLLGIGYYHKEKDMLIRQKKEELRQQFKEMLLLSTAGQRAGYSAENAFLQGYDDLRHLYGEESGICKILREMQAGLNNHITAAELWKSIGDRTGIVEIREFAHVFAIAKESGGNMGEVLENTAGTIADKAETKKEIEVIISARRMEQKIMNGMPFMLVMYINVTSPGYFEGFYGSVKGAVIMTGALLFYLAAYLLGEKIAGKEEIWQ